MSNADVEAASLLNNRRQQQGNANGGPPVQAVGTLPPNHPYHQMKRAAIMGAAIWGLHEFGVYHAILRSPDVSHEWFKIGLSASVAMLITKSYVELYEGKTKKRRVNYENYRQVTHAVILLILLASVSFHAALWPHYGGFKTILIMIMFGYGVSSTFLTFDLIALVFNFALIIRRNSPFIDVICADGWVWCDDVTEIDLSVGKLESASFLFC